MPSGLQKKTKIKIGGDIEKDLVWYPKPIPSKYTTADSTK
jgi:hypothetical protein